MMKDFLDKIKQSLSNNTFAKMSLGNYKGQDLSLNNIYIRRIVIKRADMLAFTYRHKTKDIAKNYSYDEGLKLIAALLGNDFRSATLCTTAFDLVYDRGRVQQKPPSQTEIPSTNHDHQKKRLIESTGKTWLQALDVTDAQSNVKKSAQDKFRQINRYVELVAPLITPDVKQVVDMGSGKGYLTFALYDYMTTTLNMPVRVTGVEYREDLVKLCNAIAREARFDTLHFVQGAIAGYKPEAGLDMLIALHACDTATDDAIAQGIQNDAKIIVVAPCCHKQIRREMEAGMKPDDAILRHGIFMERQAEMVTDALRALILEYHGYQVKVFEFISGEHTAKNIMITAERHNSAKSGDKAVLARIQHLKAEFGIKTHALEKILGL